MEKLQISNSIKIDIYDSQDYIQNNKQINDYLNKVLGSVSTFYARDYLDNLNGDIYIQDKKVFIFVLFESNEPVSFVIYSKKSNITASLDLIWTSEQYQKLGFATMLIRVSAAVLKDKNIATILAEATEQDEIFFNLLQSFAKVENIETKQEERKFKFGIKELDAKQILDDVKKFAIW